MEDSRYLPNQSELNAVQDDELRQELLKYYRSSLIIGLLKQSDAPISIESRALLSVYKHEGELPLGKYILIFPLHDWHDSVDYNQSFSVAQDWITYATWT